MNKILEEIYKEWSIVQGKENISFTLAMKADTLLTELDYYPSYIWHIEGKIIFEYCQGERNLYISISNDKVSGRLCERHHILEDYEYLTVKTTNTVLERFWN